MNENFMENKLYPVHKENFDLEARDSYGNPYKRKIEDIKYLARGNSSYVYEVYVSENRFLKKKMIMKQYNPTKKEPVNKKADDLSFIVSKIFKNQKFDENSQEDLYGEDKERFLKAFNKHVDLYKRFPDYIVKPYNMLQDGTSFILFLSLKMQKVWTTLKN